MLCDIENEKRLLLLLFILFFMCLFLKIWLNTFFVRPIIYRIVESRVWKNLCGFLDQLLIQSLHSPGWVPLPLPRIILPFDMLLSQSKPSHLWPVLGSFPVCLHSILKDCSSGTEAEVMLESQGTKSRSRAGFGFVRVRMSTQEQYHLPSPSPSSCVSPSLSSPGFL